VRLRNAMSRGFRALSRGMPIYQTGQNAIHESRGCPESTILLDTNLFCFGFCRRLEPEDS
jgi:hypothetical protein